jgi:hypothetical protein
VPKGDASLRPLDGDVFAWLAARRVAATGDPDELMDQRLHGALLQVFAMAAAQVEPDQGAGLVRLFLERPGPWEDQLELAATLAATAVAWGAGVEDEVLAPLLERAIQWTMPAASGRQRLAGTALLAADAWDGPYAQQSMEGAIERYRETLAILADEEYAGHPGLLATLETDLAIIVSGAEGEAEMLEPLFEQLGPLYSERLGRAITRVLVPGEAKNELLLLATEHALMQGDPGALSALDGLVEPMAGAIGPIHTTFRQVLEGEQADVLIGAARAACDAIARWRSCPELTVHLLARLVVASLDPVLRLHAAAALAAHPRAAAGSRDTVLSALKAQLGADEPLARAIAAACALFLGTEDAEAAAMAIALVADGVPPEAVGTALGEGLRRSPEVVAGLQHIWSEYGEEEPIQVATVQVLLEVAEGVQQQHEAGVFYDSPALSEYVRGELLKVLLPWIGDTAEEAKAAYAAGAGAWFGRGDAGLALTLQAVRGRLGPGQARDAFTVALGGVGVASASIVDSLAGECAEGAPEAAAAAARALMVLFDGADQLEPMTPHLPTIEARATMPGPQQEPITDLLHLMATLPLRAR